MYKEPLATILAVQDIRTNLVVTLIVEGELYPPLAPASLHPIEEPDTLVFELHKAVQRDRQQVIFHIFGSGGDKRPPPVGRAYIFRQWWSPEQLALAQDVSRHWDRQRFVPPDGVQVVLEGDKRRLLRSMQLEEHERHAGSIVQKTWDHEHCALCWQRKSVYEKDEPIGYSSEGEWLCEACYQRYIKSGFGTELGDKS